MEKTKSKTGVGVDDPKKKAQTPKAKDKGARIRKPGVRVHLPPIESYEKELEFPADGPGRVVVRLERLMGSDRVKLTDTKYMATLLERLEDEERKAWAKRRFARIKKERNRYRQLAIDGLMNPDDDMQDLYYHPVFRVNRVLNNLAKMNTNITLTPLDKLPPIVQVDPFVDDDSGSAFKYWPGHSEGPDLDAKKSYYTLSRSQSRGASQANSKTTFHTFGKAPSSATSSKASKISIKSKSKQPQASKIQLKKPPQDKTAMEGVANDQQADDEEEKEGEEEEQIEEQKRTPPIVKYKHAKRMEPVEVPRLSQMQLQYGIDPDKNLSVYEPFRGHLVDWFFHEDGRRVEELYQMADDVLGVYQREQMVADDFSSTLNRLMRDK